MQLVEIRELAMKLRAEHLDLYQPGWTFKFDNAKLRQGVTQHSTKRISLSKTLVNRTDEEIHNTITHEIAHAIAGPAHGHDQTWRRIHISLGGTGERLSRAELPAAPYQLRCPECGNTQPVYRRTRASRNSACGACCKKYSGGRYDENFHLILERTK